MALTARADWKESPGHLVEMQIASGEVIYDGALVGTATTASATSQGSVVNWLGTNEDLKFLGVARVTPTSSGDTGDSITGTTVSAIASVNLLSTIGVDVSGVTLQGVTLSAGNLTTMTQIGSVVFASDENSFTTVANAAGAVGWITKVHSASVVDIKLFTPGEHMGKPNTAVWAGT